VKQQHTSTSTSILTNKSTYRSLSAQRLSERTIHIYILVLCRGRPNKMGTTGFPQFQERENFTFCSVARFSFKKVIDTHSLMMMLFVHISSRPLYCSARTVTPRRKTRVLCRGGGVRLVTTDNYLTAFMY
jgi:hypothetical protein